MTDAAASPTVRPPSASYRAWVLGMLFLVYAFNFLDRQIISILAIPIAAELDLSDRQLGLLGGIAFAALYSTLGVPIAWLADRASRTWIITISLTLWSGFTAVCGVAQNFWQLFAARVGVGVGEAGGVAPSYSLIADYFPPHQRARALSVYSLGIPIGSAFGVVAGGLIAGGAVSAQLDWRAAFIIVGVAGLVIAPIFKLTLREPVRGGLDPIADKPKPVEKHPSQQGEGVAAGVVAEASRKPGVLAVLKHLAGKPSFWLLSLGASCSSMMGYGAFFWMPSFLARSFFADLSTAEATIQSAWLFGTVLLIGGSAGVMLGGILADRLGKARKSAYAVVPAIAFFLAFPFYIAGAMSQTATIAIVMFMIPTALGLSWLGPALSAFQHLAPPDMRSMASAIFLLINNLLGIGVGIYVLGEMSVFLTPFFAEESLRYSIMIGASLYLVAGGLFLLASRTLSRDWVK